MLIGYSFRSRAGVAFAAGEVEVKYWLPDNPTAEFVAGSTVKAVLGINNIGQDSVNVSYAGAQLAWPFDASTPVYNFTGQVGRMELEHCV